MFKCRCCSNNISEKLFSTKLLKKNVDFFECSNCKYVQTNARNGRGSHQILEKNRLHDH